MAKNWSLRAWPSAVKCSLPMPLAYRTRFGRSRHLWHQRPRRPRPRSGSQLGLRFVTEGIITSLDLKRPICRHTAYHGHFGHLTHGNKPNVDALKPPSAKPSRASEASFMGEPIPLVCICGETASAKPVWRWRSPSAFRRTGVTLAFCHPMPWQCIVVSISALPNQPEKNVAASPTTT